MRRPPMVQPRAISRAWSASPLASVSAVRVSLIVRTKQRIADGVSARCSVTLTLTSISGPLPGDRR